MSVDPLFAQWLQAEADHVVRADAAMVARWGATALSVERVTGIATLDAASIEADRQLAFGARGPFAQDVHQFVGTDWIADLGTVVTIRSPDLGYDAGIDVFVLEVDVDRAKGLATRSRAAPTTPRTRR